MSELTCSFFLYRWEAVSLLPSTSQNRSYKSCRRVSAVFMTSRKGDGLNQSAQLALSDCSSSLSPLPVNVRNPLSRIEKKPSLLPIVDLPMSPSGSSSSPVYQRPNDSNMALDSIMAIFQYPSRSGSQSVKTVLCVSAADMH